jgi:hypothetical protein
MKLISKIILLFSLYEIINSQYSCAKTSTVTKADDCSIDSIIPSTAKSEEDYVHCCYIEDKSGKYKRCLAITSYQYDNIGKFKKQYEEDYKYDYKIDCNSSYLKICLIMIISFILF